MTTEFVDNDGTTRLTGQLVVPGATPGDVLTVQADESVAPAAGGSSSPLQAASVPVTNADMLALQGTGVELVAAPGIGNTVVLVQAFFALDATAAAYGNIDMNALLGIGYAIHNPAFSNGLPQSQLGGFLGGDGDVTWATFAPFPNGSEPGSAYYADGADSDNKPLLLTIRNGGVELNGGDAANSGHVRVLYTIETLP